MAHLFFLCKQNVRKIHTMRKTKCKKNAYEWFGYQPNLRTKHISKTINNGVRIPSGEQIQSLRVRFWVKRVRGTTTRLGIAVEVRATGCRRWGTSTACSARRCRRRSASRGGTRRWTRTWWQRPNELHYKVVFTLCTLHLADFPLKV